MSEGDNGARFQFDPACSYKSSGTIVRDPDPRPAREKFDLDYSFPVDFEPIVITEFKVFGYFRLP